MDVRRRARAPRARFPRDAATIVSRWVAPPATHDRIGPADRSRALDVAEGNAHRHPIGDQAHRRHRALQQGATAEREPRLGAEAKPLAPSRGEHDPVDGFRGSSPRATAKSPGSGAPAPRERTWSRRRSKAPNANRRIAGCCRSRVRTSCQRHVAGSAAAALCSPCSTRRPASRMCSAARSALRPSVKCPKRVWA